MPKTPERDALEDALAGWRVSDTEQTFSTAARESILEHAVQARRETEMPRLAQLFVPMAKLMYAGAVPVLLLALTLGWLGASSTRDTGGGVVHIEAGKVNGEAVFRIANGGREHHVYRSASPRASAARELLTTTDDSFTDRLAGSSGVVYYRID